MLSYSERKKILKVSHLRFAGATFRTLTRTVHLFMEMILWWFADVTEGRKKRKNL